MYKGFVLSESLKNPVILNNFEKIYVKVEHHPENKIGPKIWHDFKLKFKDKDIIKITYFFSEQIKEKWYAHFWNNNEVYVVFSNKVFKIPKEPKEWQSKEYQEVKKYALAHGIGGKYLNFWIEE